MEESASHRQFDVGRDFRSKSRTTKITYSNEHPKARGGVVLFLCLSSVRLAAQPVTATVTNCDEASLRAALASVSVLGGTVNFACDGTIVLTNTITIHATDNMLLDGSGHNVVIADTTGDSLTLKNVKLGALDKHDFHFA